MSIQVKGLKTEDEEHDEDKRLTSFIDLVAAAI